MARKGRVEYRVPSLNPPLSHYTDVVKAGNFVFVSGCAALDEHGDVVGTGDVKSQARKTHENLKACLEAAGATFEDVCKVTVYLVDVNDRAAVNESRKEFFGKAKPASTLIGVKALAKPEMLVEIEAVAFVG